MNYHYDEQYYVKVLDRYIACGESPLVEDPSADGWLLSYLVSLMENELTKVMVLSNEVCARIFYDSTLLFVRACMEREKFNLQRNQSEINKIHQTQNWSYVKRRDGWLALVQQTDDKYNEYGFNGAFYKEQFEYGNYTDNQLWERMLKDWEDAVNLKSKKKTQDDLSMHKKRLDNLLNANMKSIPQYLEQNDVTKDEFYQCWGLMNGMWNRMDFERIRKIVSIQNDYPVINEVANKMGRIAADVGKESVKVSSGIFYKFEHASGSDIEGVSVGHDLNALLPIELVHCVDYDLEDVFIHRYLTNQLQLFRHKSEISNPARSLQRKPAKLKGPMIVCLDTSGSMVGKPEKIAHSLIIRLVEIANRQRRDCYLITFSIHIHCADVRKERAKLLDLLSHTSSGDTDATQMLKATINLLESKKEYINSDVLWITDFRIPKTTESLLRQMANYRKEGTRFYGLQIGKAENSWEKYFDHIHKVSFDVSKQF